MIPFVLRLFVYGFLAIFFLHITGVRSSKFLRWLFGLVPRSVREATGWQDYTMNSAEMYSDRPRWQRLTHRLSGLGLLGVIVVIALWDIVATIEESSAGR
jgi:hypothetical protein